MWYDGFFMINTSYSTSMKKIAKMKNYHTFANQFFKLCNMAYMRYKLKGLPDTVSERLILQSLLIYGNIVFMEKGGAIFALPSIPGGKGYNINGDPISAYTFSMNGNTEFTKEVPLYVQGGLDSNVLNYGMVGQKNSNNSGVLIWENKTRYPFINSVIYYASQIADTLRTIDTAKVWLKVPSMPICEEALVQSVKDVFKALKNNDEIIPVAAGVRGLEKFDLKPVGDITRNIQTATELVDWYEMAFRAECGFKSNTAIDKKGENLIADEVNINDSITDTTTDTIVEFLQSQFDRVNSIFGTNITVEINEAMQTDNAGQEEKDGDLQRRNDI